MMAVNEAAIKWGCSRTPILRALKAGRIPGAKLMEKHGSPRLAYFIPDDTEKPDFIKPRSREYQRRKKNDEDNPVHPIQHADISGVSAEDCNRAAFIWENQCKMTIGQLAKELEISCREVTVLFDLGFSLFSSGGTSNELEEG